jgi:hypothetical protein
MGGAKQPLQGSNALKGDFDSEAIGLDPGSVFVITALRAPGQSKESISPPTTKEAAMSQQKYPPGWDEKRIREVLAHYED